MKQMARRPLVRHPDDTFLFDEDVNRWTWRDAVEFIGATVILGGLVAVVMFLLAIGGPA